MLPRSLKAALVPWFAKIPLRTGFRGELRYGVLNDIRPLDERLDQTVKRFVALGVDPPGEPPFVLPRELQPRLAIDAANLERLRREHDFGDGARVVALMPGAEYGPAKRWPAAQLRRLWRARWPTPATHVSCSAPRRNARSARRSVRPPRASACAIYAARRRSPTSSTCIAAADVAVSNDSGLLHVAAATGTHVVAIYGSSSPTFTPPLAAATTVLYRGIECSPCFARECPLGHLRCLREISTGDVLGAVERAAEAARARQRGVAAREALDEGGRR